MTPQELIAKATNLPPVPYAALKLVNLLGNSFAGNDEIVEVLKCDNVLTAKLLRACNSPAFGLAEPALSVDQAVFLLGHKQILQVVLTLSMGKAMKCQAYAVETDELWMHSFMTATAAEAVAAEFPDLDVDPSVAFTVGLLHDIGKLVMFQTLTPAMREEINQRVQESQLSGSGAEWAVLGTDHGEVGGCLLEDWKLPAEIVEAVAHHHNPKIDPEPRLSVVAHLANCIAHLAGPAPRWDGCSTRVDRPVVIRLAVTGDRLKKLTGIVRDSFDRMDLFMSMG